MSNGNVLDQLFGKKQETAEQTVNTEELVEDTTSTDNIETPEVEDVKPEGGVTTDDFPSTIVHEPESEKPVVETKVEEDIIAIDISDYKLNKIKEVLDETPSTDFELVNLKNKIYSIIG